MDTNYITGSFESSIIMPSKAKTRENKLTDGPRTLF